MKSWTWLPLCLLPTVAMADLEIDNSISLRAGIWSSDRSLTADTDILTSALWGRQKADLGDQGKVVLDWQANTQSANRERGGLIREAYWQYYFGDHSLKVGRQIIVWGRADGVNPTDNLSPRNYRFLTPEDGEQRYGNSAVNLSTDTGSGTFSTIWFPEAAASSIPLQPMPGIDYRTRTPHRSQWAVKWDRMFDNFDGSLSYFEGIDPMPVLVPGAISATGAVVEVQAQRARILGADFSMARDATIWRSEAAYSDTPSKGSTDFLHKKPQFRWIGGAEWQILGSATLGMQLTYTHVFDYANPKDMTPGFERSIAIRQLATSAQTSPEQYGYTWRLANRWINDLLSVEFSGVADQTEGSGIARLKTSYAVNDRLSLKGGYDYYYGPIESFFGQLRDNKLLYAQIEYSL
ncbi:hypothetical protein [Pseudomonas frederiksbergensis]|nr:hypothetical protein [Pseudomonas frederiksbergensis]